MNRWYVVNTRPHQELRAELNLKRQGYRAWLPVMERSRRHARRIETIRVPVFPGYLFVELDIEREAWGAINGTFGVRRLLADGGRPQALPDAFVAALWESGEREGTCVITPEILQPGETVRITSGPFVDCIAVVQELSPGERVKLLLNVLGGRITAEVSRRAVASAA